MAYIIGTMNTNKSLSTAPVGFDVAFFEALADPLRRRILTMLLERDERCVCELHGVLGESQPKVSRHLAVLREAAIVATRRDGVWMHYRIHPELPAWAFRVLWHMKEGMAPVVSAPAASCTTCE
jgi:ArsR family transcriptional regulator, arsenate/arsenite/antimonite-responsive transcriptional repressor